MRKTPEKLKPIKSTAATELPSKSRKNPGTPKSFDRVVGRFVLEIDSLASTLPLAMKSITAAQKGAAVELGRFMAEHGKPIKGSEKSIQLDTAHISGFQRLWHSLDRTSVASALVPKSFLVALVSQFDNFLGLLIETILLSKPEILNGSERTISFPELVGFESIEAARQHIIEKEVEAVLRESHAEQFEWLGTC